MENYEALGRYVATSELAEKQRVKRDQVISKLKSLAESLDTGVFRGSSGGSFHAAAFEIDKVQGLVDEISALDQELRSTVEEANKYAAQCEKPPLKFYPAQRY